MDQTSGVWLTCLEAHPLIGGNVHLGLWAVMQVWSVTRSKGKTIPSGGTLVVGREQDCEGGCFDSAEGEPIATFCMLMPSQLQKDSTHRPPPAATQS